MWLMIGSVGCFGDGEPSGDPSVRAAITCPEGTEFRVDKTDRREAQLCSAGGKMHGDYVEFYLNGQRAVSGRYLDDHQVDEWMWWYDDGQKKESGRYVKGKRTGGWTGWYQNKNMEYSGDFLGDKKAGHWTTWYESGRRQAEGMYQNGKEDGVWTYFKDAEGNEVERTQYFRYGKPVDANGNPMEEKPKP